MFAVGGLTALGALPVVVAGAAAVAWYGAQWVVARRAGWARSPMQVAAWLLRDLLIPGIWVAAQTTRGFVWRGHTMGVPTPQTITAA